MNIPSKPDRISALAPFSVRSYRFQWPADLLISCAIEMELPILGWYILVQTNSVLMLVLFGSAQYIGTLISPLMGVVGDRIGCRNLLFAMRACYTVLSLSILLLSVFGLLNASVVLAISAVGGILRPSDGMVRNTLIAQTVPHHHLMVAIGVSRITQDISRVLGALIGTGIVTWAGMDRTYELISVLYIAGMLMTLGARQIKTAPKMIQSPFRDTLDGLLHVWNSPTLLAAFWIAFIVNLTAYPFTLGLLPHVTRDVYGIDQSGLGLLVASFSFGGFLASVALSFSGHVVKAGRAMVFGGIGWYVLLLLFGQTDHLTSGMASLVLAGFAQNICTIPMFVMMLKVAPEEYRGRVMGVRMLAIYGLPLGLMLAGPLIEHFGFPLTNLIMVTTGLAMLALVSLIWRKQIWEVGAQANHL
jgi:predicted MFS family arabinose efflux permease